jgi:Tol biopolymer transport system component
MPEAPALEDAALADEEPYEVAQDVILYSASRVVQEGNRVYELEDIYAVVAAPEAVAELVANNAKQPTLSPDRQTLAFRSMQSDMFGLGGYDLNTGQRLRLSSFLEDSLPRWSPAGDQIVFASDREGDRKWRVYITEAVAKESPSEFTAAELGFGQDPDWHPAEALIVFKGCDETGNRCGLWTMNADGSERNPLTDEPSDSRPRWTPDGSAVIFMSEGRDGNWELYQLSVADNAVTRLTEEPAPDGLPAVSPDGQQIAFISKRGDAWGLWVMPTAGGEAALITPIEGDLPDWLIQAVDWPK